MFIVAGVPSSDWASNARAAGEATVHKGRRAERVRMVEMSVEEARPLLREFPVRAPTGVGFIKNAGLATEPNPDEFEALAAGTQCFASICSAGPRPCSEWLSSYPAPELGAAEVGLFGRREYWPPKDR